MAQNDQKIILYDISFNLEGERVLFHPLSSHFVKENPCVGCCGVGLFGHFCPKRAFGCKKSEGKGIFQREANLAISLEIL